jgi:hypothetical protein
MSNDLIMSIKNDLMKIEGGVDEDTRAVAGNGNGSKRISIKGGVFRKMVGGKEVGAIEDRHMNIIFVKMAHGPSRTYYASGYQEGAVVSPTCWSSNSKTPDADVKKAQATSCDKCPMSIKGSGQGGMGSACRIQWRTAVVLPNDPSGDVMQLVIPGKSCFGESENGKYPFRPYVQMLANNTISAGRVVTRMSFDTKYPVPRVLFSAVAAVGGDDVPMILEQSKSVAAENAVKLTVYQMDEGRSAQQTKGLDELFTEEEAAPQQMELPLDEPVPLKRESKKAEVPADESDVPDIIKKWSKKKV